MRRVATTVFLLLIAGGFLATVWLRGQHWSEAALGLGVFGFLLAQRLGAGLAPRRASDLSETDRRAASRMNWHGGVMAVLLAVSVMLGLSVAHYPEVWGVQWRWGAVAATALFLACAGWGFAIRRASRNFLVSAGR